MSLVSSMGISASGLTAERTRMDLIASNIANVNTVAGRGGSPYRRQLAVLTPRLDGGVAVSQIVEDQSPFREERIPGHPMANKATGIVRMPNVNTVSEMVDLITASRAYEANVTAFNAAKTMIQRALDLGRV